jgi:hypothetical protein
MPLASALLNSSNAMAPKDAMAIPPAEAPPKSDLRPESIPDTSLAFLESTAANLDKHFDLEERGAAASGGASRKYVHWSLARDAIDKEKS